MTALTQQDALTRLLRDNSYYSSNSLCAVLCCVLLTAVCLVCVIQWCKHGFIGMDNVLMTVLMLPNHALDLTFFSSLHLTPSLPISADCISSIYPPSLPLYLSIYLSISHSLSTPPPHTSPPSPTPPLHYLCHVTTGRTKD